WDLHAMWDDFQFGVKHYSDLERIAIVGDRKWEEWMAKLCKPFTKASVNYFDVSQIDAAWAWLREGA
ncbi:MAG TPA: STAS/SEC14 domain-containing protein, partial [Candidatus Competibacter sp.]|nr:STAS/SEC14 domain-containing protein [Candidatus Competibacter sp.]